MWKKILLGFVAFSALIILISLALPTTYRVSHEEHIVAAPRMIFVYIGHLPRWQQWAVPLVKGSSIQAPLGDDSTYGVGASLQWIPPVTRTGMGNTPPPPLVSLSVTEWTLGQSLAYDISFAGWPAAQARFQLAPARQGALLKWQLVGDIPGKNPVIRYLGLYKRWVMKRNIRASLMQLKALTESSVAAEVIGPWSPRQKVNKVNGNSKKKNPTSFLVGFQQKKLASCYSPTVSPLHYHRR